MENTHAEESPSEVWHQLSSKYPDHPDLQADPLYALPGELIVLMDDKVPGLMTEEQMTFELDLADLTGGGFLFRRPFGYALLDEPEYRSVKPARVAQLDERQHKSAFDIKELMVDEMRESGASDAAIREFFASEAAMNAEVARCQAAYAGWLISNPEFLRERDGLRNAFDQLVVERQSFPMYPRSFFGEVPEIGRADSDNRDAYATYLRFLRRWGLDGFATWDLPIPMGMEMNQLFYEVGQNGGRVGFHNSLGLSDAGSLFFVPWCMLASKKYGFRELASHYWRYQCPDHVRGWLDHEQKNCGIETFIQLLRIHRHLHLAILPRYGSLPKWKVTMFDKAYAEYISTSPHTVKAARLRLSRSRRPYASQ
ncbi:MAG: hypothetical protein QGG71_19855 [Pirellulaceae bacterium]|jgi:hypothetical protein|nr:hypothetical protein [Pirellulaceae bacterium]